MNTLQKIAEQLLCDLEGVPTIDQVKQREVKLDAIKDAILKYHQEDDDMDRADLVKDFDVFWTTYGKKVGRAPALKKWMKLKRVDINKILATVEDFVRAHPDIQYRPHPVTYINQRRWEDELPGAKPIRVPGTRVNTWQY